MEKLFKPFTADTVFDGSHILYQSFKVALENKLKLKGVFGVLAMETCPCKLPTKTQRRVKSGKQLTTIEDRAYKDFLKWNDKFNSDCSIACAVIESSLGEGPSGMVSHITTSDDTDHVKVRMMMEQLHNVYGQGSEASKMELDKVMMELEAPVDFDGALTLMSRMIFVNNRLRLLRVDAERSDGAMKSILFQKLSAPIFDYVVVVINSQNNMTFLEVCELIRRSSELKRSRGTFTTAPSRVPVESSILDISGSISTLSAENTLVTCFNCNGPHPVRSCTAPMCRRCLSCWDSITDPTYHMYMACPGIKRSRPNGPMQVSSRSLYNGGRVIMDRGRGNIRGGRSSGRYQSGGRSNRINVMRADVGTIDEHPDGFSTDYYPNIPLYDDDLVHEYDDEYEDEWEENFQIRMMKDIVPSGSPDQLALSVLLDSGANMSACPRSVSSLFNIPIKMWANAKRVEFGNGTVCFTSEYLDLGPVLGDTAIIDDTKVTVLSVPLANLGGFSICFTCKLTCNIFDKENTLVLCVPLNKVDKLYYAPLRDIIVIQQNLKICQQQVVVDSGHQQIQLRKKCKVSHIPSATVAQVMWLHKRMNHCPPGIMASAIRNGAWIGVDILATDVESVFRHQDCVACMLGKARLLDRSIGSGVVSVVVAELISCDWVPVEPMARGGFRGFFLFREMSCGYVVSVLAKSKKEFVLIVKRVHAFYLQYGHRIKYLRVDAGKVENAMGTLVELNTLGITVQSAAPECQYQNPVERTVQTVGRGVATILCDQSLLDNSFWGLALQHFVVTMNSVPNTLCPDISPQFVVTRKNPDLRKQFLYPFGQPVVAVKLQQERESFRFGTHGEFGIICGTPVSANGASLVYFPGRNGSCVYIRRNIRPIKIHKDMLGAKRDISIQPVFSVNTGISGNETDIILTLPSNPRLQEPGLKYTEYSSVDSPEGVPSVIEHVMGESEVAVESLNVAGADLVTDNNVNIVDDVHMTCAQGPIVSHASEINESNIDSIASEPIDLSVAKDNRQALSEMSPYITGSAVAEVNDYGVIDQQEATISNGMPKRNERKRIIPYRYRTDNNSINSLSTECSKVNFDIYPFVSQQNDSPTLSQAMKDPQWNNRWVPAINKEFATLNEMGTGTSVTFSDIPAGAEVYPTKMLLTTKRDVQSSWYLDSKARLVVIGNMFTSIWKTFFAPTTHEKSLKLLFALAVTLGMLICSIDINGAFLYPNQKRDVYIILPVLLTGEPKRYWKLNKTLYGLRDSPQAFYEDMSTYLLYNEYYRTTSDPCMFYKRESATEFIMFVVHVDDFAIAASTIAMKNKLLAIIAKRYKFKECSTVESFLGVHVEYFSDGSVLFSQPGRIDDILRTYELLEVTPPSVPMIATFNDAYQSDSPKCDYTAFMTLLGILLFVVKTRPDIAYAVNRLATRTSIATERDFLALLRIASYLGGTRNLGIKFRRNVSEFYQEALTVLFCWVDASHGSHLDSKSHSGYCFSLGSWITGMFYSKSFKQSNVTLSSMEAENSSAVEATKEILWFRSLLEELGFPQLKPTEIFADNASMITVAEDFSGNHKRVKHFLTRINFLIENVKNQVISFTHVSSQDNIADILTKPLGPIDFLRLRPKLLGTDV